MKNPNSVINYSLFLAFCTMLLSSCGNPDGMPVEIYGPATVCENSDAMYHTKTNMAPNWTFVWVVPGGTITDTSANNDSIWVRWDNTANFGNQVNIRCVATTYFGKNSDMRKVITINGGPKITTGPKDVCLDPDFVANYVATVPAGITGATWSVSPANIGTIVNQSATNCRIRFTQTGNATIKISGICAGSQANAFYATTVHTITNCPGNVPK